VRRGRVITRAALAWAALTLAYAVILAILLTAIMYVVLQPSAGHP
jgi:hypothetical protein